MTVWMEAKGAMRLRACDKVNALIAKLAELVNMVDKEALTVDTADDENFIDVGLDMGREGSIGSVTEIDDCLREFSPYVKEPARFVTSADDSRETIWLGDREAVLEARIFRLAQRRLAISVKILALTKELESLASKDDPNPFQRVGGGRATPLLLPAPIVREAVEPDDEPIGPFFELDVIETRSQKVRYVVEAPDADEAKEKAESGETERETDLGTCEVVNRVIFSGPKELKSYCREG